MNESFVKNPEVKGIEKALQKSSLILDYILKTIPYNIYKRVILISNVVLLKAKLASPLMILAIERVRCEPFDQARLMHIAH